VGLVPERLLPHITSGLARWLFVLKTEAARVTLINIKIFDPNLSERAAQDMCLSSLSNSLMLIYELSKMRFSSRFGCSKLTQDIENIEIFEKAQGMGRGVLLLMPHLGCWEFMNVFLKGRAKVSALYDKPNVSGLDDFITSTREKFGARMFPINASGLRQVFKSLERNELLVFLPDQVPDYGARGFIGTFFGHDAYTSDLVHRVIKKYDSEIVFGSVMRDFSKGKVKYRICFEKPAGEIYSEDVEKHITALNRSLERLVMKAPEQYQWSYKRYKRLNKSEKNIYRRQ
jgi:KDO2-lipid IV(A) lauroyltransferase